MAFSSSVSARPPAPRRTPKFGVELFKTSRRDTFKVLCCHMTATDRQQDSFHYLHSEMFYVVKYTAYLATNLDSVRRHVGVDHELDHRFRVMSVPIKFCG